jgi:hypothetical protein
VRNPKRIAERVAEIAIADLERLNTVSEPHARLLAVVLLLATSGCKIDQSI